MDISKDIPMVSSDGEPHEILTLIAVSAGCLAAVAILIALWMNVYDENREQRRFSLFSVRRSIEITQKPQIYTISDSLDTKIAINENEKYFYIPGIATV